MNKEKRAVLILKSRETNEFKLMTEEELIGAYESDEGQMLYMTVHGEYFEPTDESERFEMFTAIPGFIRANQDHIVNIKEATGINAVTRELFFPNGMHVKVDQHLWDNVKEQYENR